MRAETFAAIEAAGFRVYVRHINDTYCHFTSPDGLAIGYLEESRFGGFNLSTVHVPNLYSGTGYRVERDSSGPLTREFLSRAFVLRPAWGHGPLPIKWRNWDHFAKANSFNEKYKELP